MADLDRPTSASRLQAIVDQFSDRGPQAAIWRGFDTVLDTDAFLNLGYSSGLHHHLVGDPQRRLARRVAEELEDAGVAHGDTLCDLGCGRGGPTIELATQLHVDAIGLDLVPFNLHLARVNAYDAPVEPRFVRGELHQLPFRNDGADAVTAIDSLVYVARPASVIAEMGRVLRPTGTAVITDLLLADANAVEPTAHERFCQAWGLAPLVDVATYRDTITEQRLHIDAWTDITDNSVGQFRKWTNRYLRLRAGPLGGTLEAAFDHLGLDVRQIDEQVEATHDVLPELRHVLARLRTGR